MELLVHQGSAWGLGQTCDSCVRSPVKHSYTTDNILLAGLLDPDFSQPTTKRLNKPRLQKYGKLMLVDLLGSKRLAEGKLWQSSKARLSLLLWAPPCQQF